MSSSSIESVLHEERVFEPPHHFAQHARIPSMAVYQAMCDEADKDYAGFWAKRAMEEVVWHKPFTRTLDESQAPFYKWFDDGLLNVSYNCLDKNLENGNADKVAIIFEADNGDVTRVTYRELHARVCALANGIKSLGYKKGDRALIYMPMSVEGVAAMQACARLGVVHSVVFGGFSAKSLQERVVDAGATLIIAADEQCRGGKNIPLKPAVDEAFGLGGCEGVRHVIVYRRTGNSVPMTPGRDIPMDELVKDQPAMCPPEWVEAEHPLFILYTSGSTGKPKGVQHSSGGYLLHAILTMKYTFDIQPNDVYWCTADIGWVTGHTYITYGPLATGATQIVFEGVPTYPNAGRFWKMIQDHKVSVFYTAPTAIRSLIKAGETSPETHPQHFDLRSLRLLGSVGEPINPEAWMWYHTQVGHGRCPIVDTFWQTETGGHMITPMPGATPLVPGSCTLPFPGIQAAIVDEAGHDLPNGQGGILVVKRPWPSMIRTIWGDPERFKKSYYPEELGGRLYLAGDGAIRDADTGYFTIMGRIDD
ncbi:MAG: acetate--CoA ligase, partial [Betaproteobacteria bacterium]|nr:acetate--CoA ligase [Betaproteobacteria bacterium]